MKSEALAAQRGADDGASARIFGLALTAVFASILVLNAIFY
jgi:hypothetical protein